MQGGLFASSSMQPQNSNLFGAQSQQPTSLFGGGASSFGGGASAFGTGQVTQPQGGLFGAPTQTQSTGGFGQSQPQGFGAFGGTQLGGGSTFGGGFGGGNAPSNQNQPFGNNLNSFSQASGSVLGSQSNFSAFGQTPGQGTGFGGNAFGGGMSGGLMGGFNSNQQTTVGSTLFGGASNTGGQFGQPQQQQLAKPDGLGAGFYNAIQVEQSVHTIQVQFTSKQESSTETAKPGVNQMQIFSNIRIEPKFTPHSGQMLRILDMMAMKTNQPQTSYEFIAANEYKSNPSAYPLAHKLVSQPQQLTTAGNVAGGSLFKSQTPGFGGVQNSNQKPGGLFGSQQTSTFGQSTGGGFGMQQSTGLGGAGGSLFGQGNATPGFGGQSAFNTAQASTGFGGLATGSTLFGGNKPTQGLGGALQMGQTSSQGLFNNQQNQQQPAGLFGAGGNAFQQQQPSNPLFQQPTAQPGNFLQQAPTQQTGLFNQSAQPKLGGTLFGQQPQQTQQPSFGGGILGGNQGQGTLFSQGIQQQQPTLGQQPSIFGQQPQQQQQQQPLSLQPTASTSLFGNTGGGGSFLNKGTSLAPATGGLFAPQPTQSNTLNNLSFGQPPQTQQPGQGLFSQTPSTLFGGGQNAQPTAGIFGTNQPQLTSQPFQGGNSLCFPQQQPSAQMFQPTPQQTQQPIDLYDQTRYQADPFGIKGSFLEKESPFQDVEKEITRIKDEAALDKKNNPYAQLLEKHYYYKVDENNTVVDLKQTEIVHSYFHMDAAEEQERESFNEALKYKKHNIKEGDNKKYKPMIYGGGPSPFQKFSTIRNANLMSRDDASSDQTSQKSSKQKNNRLDTTQLLQSQKPIDGKKEKQVSDLEKAEQKNKDIYTIRVWIYEDSNEPYFTEFDIHNSRNVKDIYQSVEQFLVTKARFDRDNEKYSIVFMNQPLKDTLTIKEAGIQDESQIHVTIEQKQRAEEIPRQRISQEKQAQNLRQIQTERIQQVNPQAPKPPKEGCITTPSIQELSKMSDYQLEKVKDFTIEDPRFGKIEFIKETDVAGLDLADLVTIKHQTIEVYDDKRHKKPAEGQKLNKPAIITLYNIPLKEGETLAGKEQKLRRIIEGEDGEHISYNAVQKVWKFKVKHFTKYGLDEESEDMEDQSVQSPEQQKQVITSQLHQHSFASSAQRKEDQKDSLIQSQYLPFPTTSQQQAPFQQQPSLPQFKNEQSFKSGVTSSMQSQYHPDDYNYDKVSVASQSSQGRKQRSELYLTNRDQMALIPGDIKPQRINRAQKRIDMEMRINEREKKIHQLDVFQDKLPMNDDVMNYLGSLGIKQFKKTNLSQNACVRPCFRNDGTLLTVSKNGLIKTNKISTAMKEIHDNQLNQSQLFQNLVIHSKISEFDDSMIEGQLNQMSLNRQGDAEMARQDLDRSGSKQLIEDPFIRELFQTLKLPAHKFLQSTKEIFQFLKDVAQDYLNQMKKEVNVEVVKRLQEEFYIVCMLNALFGNPNIHLIQLHSKYNELNNYISDLKEYEEHFIDGDSHVVGKKRRNAVTELLRFICQIDHQFVVHPLPTGQLLTLDKLYENTLNSLLNGDIKQALQLLTENKKTKMALIISQALGNVQNKEILAQQFVNNPIYFANFNKNAFKIVELLTGNFKFKEYKTHWIRALNNYLLVQIQPQLGLKTAIGIFDAKCFKNVYEQNHRKLKYNNLDDNVPEMPLLYLLLKAYANVDGTPEKDLAQKVGNMRTHRQLETFFNVKVSEVDVKYKGFNHKMKWLAQLMIRQVGQNYRKQVFDNQKAAFQDYHMKLGISDIDFALTSSQYANELLLLGNPNQALLVTSFIPCNYEPLKKKLIFDILSLKTLNYLAIEPHKQYDKQSQGQVKASFNHGPSFENSLNFIQKTLLIPERYVNNVRSILFEYRMSIEKAIEEWKLAGNYQQVFNIVMRQILPLYFQFTHQKDRVGALLASHKQTLKHELDQFKKVANKLHHWEARGLPILNFLDILNVNGVKSGQKEAEKLFDSMDSWQIDNQLVFKFIEEVLTQAQLKKVLYSHKEIVLGSQAYRQEDFISSLI